MRNDDPTPAALSRRRFLASAGALGFSTWVNPHRLFAGSLVDQIRRAAETDPIIPQMLRGDLTVLMGNGGNVLVLPGDDGVLLIDGGIVGQRVAASVAQITKRPIRHLVNTHWHFDHTDANEFHHAHGATIVAHENTANHMSVATRVEDWNYTFPPSPAGAMPQAEFTDARELKLNGTVIRLRHYEPAHTDGDISAYFVDADVLHTGDTWSNGLYPFVDYGTGGRIDGMICATERNLEMVSGATIIVPGHGFIGNRAELLRWRDMLVTVRDRVARLKQSGQPLSAVIAAKPTAEFDADYGGGIVGPELFTRVVYQSL